MLSLSVREKYSEFCPNKLVSPSKIQLDRTNIHSSFLTGKCEVDDLPYLTLMSIKLTLMAIKFGRVIFIASKLYLINEFDY
jgi:hypothetical protein